jgi:hypothetical protein
MPDFGTVRENAAAFDVAVAAIHSGDIAWGCSILTALRDHIWSTEESKSIQWILPKVLEALDKFMPCTPTTTPHVR